MGNPFTAHPAAVGATYRQHFRLPARFDAKMAGGGLAALVHAVLPFCFVTTACRCNGLLVAMRAASRGRAVKVRAVGPMEPLDYRI